MTQKNRRLSKIIDLALMNAGISEKEDNLSSSKEVQNTIETYVNNNNRNMNINHKKQVRKKLVFDDPVGEIPANNIIKNNVLPTTSGISSACLTADESDVLPITSGISSACLTADESDVLPTTSGISSACLTANESDVLPTTSGISSACLTADEPGGSTNVVDATQNDFSDELLADIIPNTPNSGSGFNQQKGDAKCLMVDENLESCSGGSKAVYTTLNECTTFQEFPNKYLENEPLDNTPNTMTSASGSIQQSLGSTNTIADQNLEKGNRRGRKRNCKTDKRYIDYLSDVEDFTTFMEYDDADLDSDAWKGSDTSEDDDVVESNKGKKGSKTKKKKKRVSNIPEEEIVGETAMTKKRINVRKDRVQKRRAGKEFTNKDGKIISAKSVQPNPCCGKKCGNNCENITNEKRHKIFDHFWSLSVERRRDWLVSLVQKCNVKRKRSNSDLRNITFKYHINEGEGKRTVCLQFLAATLNVSSKCIYNTAKKSQWGTAKDDLRGKCIPVNKTKPASLEAVANFIKGLPAVPSHYCRQDSSRVYLSSEFKNVSYVYNVYKKQMTDNGIDYVGERVFRRIFSEDFNIGFHVPKKDKCLKCLKFEQSDKTNAAVLAEKTAHDVEKEESYNRFYAHKQVYKTDPSTLCVSFDLEKVLNTPHGESMLLYYSRKLAVYNLCFYENVTRRVNCYYWDECNGKRGANEISSILQKYIKSVDERGSIKNLLLYCDCCPGQNRNKILLAMIHMTLQTCQNLETIQMNYLLTGHTYMPVDSVHAVIERNLKNIIIHAPSQWYTVFATARKDPFPYQVERLSFEDFYKWDNVAEKYFKGNLSGKISKIRIVTFKKKESSKVFVKYSMNKSAKSSEIEVQMKTRLPLLPCFRSLLPISKAKQDDLLKLCRDKVIPSNFHQEYTSIPGSSSIKDTLPDSDIEDIESQK